MTFPRHLLPLSNTRQITDSGGIKCPQAARPHYITSSAMHAVSKSCMDLVAQEAGSSRDFIDQMQVRDREREGAESRAGDQKLGKLREGDQEHCRLVSLKLSLLWCYR